MPDNPALGMAANEKHGHAEIRAGVEERRAGGIQGPGTNTRHVLTTIAVDVESSDRATSRSYFMFFDSTTTPPMLRTMGQYDDVLAARRARLAPRPARHHHRLTRDHTMRRSVAQRVSS